MNNRFCRWIACLHVSITTNKKFKLGWKVKPIFTIALHVKDKALLEEIQSYFGAGQISIHGRESVQLQVQSIKELKIIIDHFYKYSLITKKCSDLKLFIKIIDIIKSKEHLTYEGLRKIVAIRASPMNLGLSEKLKLAFPDVVPSRRDL